MKHLLLILVLGIICISFDSVRARSDANKLKQENILMKTRCEKIVSQQLIELAEEKAKLQICKKSLKNQYTNKNIR